uniref:SET domain-containing protein n=2 Tax=Biomphalaria glabrata TaxID=6526 RepID=A0A2C9KSQ2_BIOGL
MVSRLNIPMRNPGRCGRHRRQKHNIKSVISESHLPEIIRFQQWMKHSLPGRQHSDCKTHLEPAHFTDTGRGLKCLYRIEEGDVVVSIPYHLLITTNLVFSSDLQPIIERVGIMFTPQQLLTVFLISELFKKEHSFWHPYISLLPNVYFSSVYFSPEEMKLLTKRAHCLALEYRERFEGARKKILEFINTHVPWCEGKVSLEHIKWAWSTIDTRSVYLLTEEHPLLVIDPEESHVALAPLLDFLNHKDTAQVRAGINPGSLSYEIITDDKYKKYEQVFISYGPHDNTRLAINYGFTLPNNIHNVFHFSLEDIKACLNVDSASLGKKQAIIQENGFDLNLFCNKDGLSWSLMVALKIFTIPKEFLSLWKTISHDASTSSEYTNLASKLAIRLLTEALLKVQHHLQYVVMQPKSTHFHIAEKLALDDVHILQASLKVVQSQFIS